MNDDIVRNTWKEFEDAGLLLILDALFAKDNINWEYDEIGNTIVANGVVKIKDIFEIKDDKYAYIKTTKLVTINKLLCIFGWAIFAEISIDKDSRLPVEIHDIYPQRIKFRKFSDSNEKDLKNYVRISKWMKDNAEELLDEARN